MPARLRIRKRTVLHLAAMAGVLGLAAGFAAQNQQPEHAELTPSTGLLVSTRDDFRLCVHTTEAVSSPARARADLAAGLAEVRQHPDWQAAFGASSHDAEAADTCPAVRLPGSLGRASLVGPGLTEDPSPYRTWVHILDERTADRVLGPGVPAATAPAEVMRSEGRDAATVSTAVLVRRGYLDDPQFRSGVLTRGVGLSPTGRGR